MTSGATVLQDSDCVRRWLLPMFWRQFAEAWRARERQMGELPRLNNVIRAWEEGKPAFTSFAQAEVETAVAMSTSKFDGVVYEMEHNFWDARALRDAMQYMLNRRQIVQGGSLAPAATPRARLPPNA